MWRDHIGARMTDGTDQMRTGSALDGLEHGPMQVAVKRCPALGGGRRVDYDARYAQSRGEVRNAGIVTHQQPCVAEQCREGTERGAAREIETRCARELYNRCRQETLRFRSRQYNLKSQFHQGVDNGSESVGRPAPRRGARTRMDTNVLFFFQPGRLCDSVKFIPVARKDRKLQFFSLQRDADKLHEPQRAPDLRFLFRVGQKMARVRSIST